jgi:hypothetical protein
MINVNGKWKGICDTCGEPVAGYADPRTDAIVPAPERGEAARCLLCLLTKGGPLIKKSELVEAEA